MLYKLWEKFDPLNKAEKDLAENTKKLTGEYEALASRIERLDIKKMTDQFGAAAGMRLAGVFATGALETDEARLKTLDKQIAQTQAGVNLIANARDKASKTVAA